MSHELALLKERLNHVAIRHGLPPIGATMVNQYGIEWLVDGHIFVPSLFSIARCGVDGITAEDPSDLYPVIIPQNLSTRLLNFITETDLCTSKAIMPLDTVPHIRTKDAHPHGHSIDGLTDPHRVVLFLDAAHAHETIIAHEIGHIWIDLVEDCEDYRVLKDLSRSANVFLWTSLQSFVLDNKVNDVLREKGFDMSVIEADVNESLHSFSVAALSGYRPPTAREAAFVASILAMSMLSYETGAKGALQNLDMATTVFRRDLPDVYQLACRLAATIRHHGYSDRESIRNAIDACALLSFAFIGEGIDLDNELIEEESTEAYDDKHPEFFSGLPVPAKLEIGRAMAKLKVPAGSDYRLSPTPSGTAQIQFCGTSGIWTPPVSLNHFPRSPHSIAFGVSQRSQQKGDVLMQKPVQAMPPRNASPPSFPGDASILAPKSGSMRRTYGPGIARFMSQVRLEEQLKGESLYGYALNNPIRYTDPSGLMPCELDSDYCQKKPPSDCSTYPGGPCAYAKSKGALSDNGGGVICCNSVKPILCSWQPPSVCKDAFDDCTFKHEQCHADKIKCPPKGYSLPKIPNRPADECRCTNPTLDCLRSWLHKEKSGRGPRYNCIVRAIEIVCLYGRDMCSKAGKPPPNC